MGGIHSEYGTQYLTLEYRSGFGHNKNEAFGSEDCSLSAASSSSSSSLRSSSSYVVVFVTISPSASISARLFFLFIDFLITGIVGEETVA